MQPNVYIGLTRVPDGQAEYTYYMPALQVVKKRDVPPGMTVDTVPAHQYGVFHYIGFHHPDDISSRTLGALWEQVFRNWMPTVKFEVRERFSFERIDWDAAGDTYCEADIYYPIAKI